MESKKGVMKPTDALRKTHDLITFGMDNSRNFTHLDLTQSQFRSSQHYSYLAALSLL